MSEWSSFEHDKKTMDKWRIYLEESEDIKEGSLGDAARKISRWGAGKKIKKMVGRGQVMVGSDEEEPPTPGTPTPTPGTPPPVPATPTPPVKRDPKDDDFADMEFGEKPPAPAPSASEEETDVKPGCEDFFDLDDPEIRDLLDQAKVDASVRGAVASLARDLSLTLDAATLTLAAATVAFPNPFTAGAAGSTLIGARVAAGVAVTFDLLSGQWMQAAIDSVGMIPGGGALTKTGTKVGGKVAGKVAGKVGGKVVAKTGAKAGAKVAGKVTGKTAAKAAAKGGERGIARTALKVGEKAVAQATAKVVALEAKIVETLVKAGVPEVTAKALTTIMMVKTKTALGDKLTQMMGEMPQRKDYPDSAAHKKALKIYYDKRREETAKIFAACSTGGEDGVLMTNLKKFLAFLHGFVDDVPRWLDSAIDWFFDDDEEEETEKEPPKKVKPKKPKKRGGTSDEDIGLFNETLRPGYLTESETHRWQQLAGIKKRVI